MKNYNLNAGITVAIKFITDVIWHVMISNITVSHGNYYKYSEIIVLKPGTNG